MTALFEAVTAISSGAILVLAGVVLAFVSGLLLIAAAAWVAHRRGDKR